MHLFYYHDYGLSCLVLNAKALRPRKMLLIFQNLCSDAKYKDQLVTSKCSNCSQKCSALGADILALLWLKMQNQSHTQKPHFMPLNCNQVRDPSHHLPSRHVSPLFPNSPYSKANFMEEEPNHKLHYMLRHSRQVNKQGSEWFFWFFSAENRMC